MIWGDEEETVKIKGVVVQVKGPNRVDYSAGQDNPTTPSKSGHWD